MNNITDNAPTTKEDEPVQVTTKDLKKVTVGKRLAEFNHRRKEAELAEKSEAQKSKPNLSQAYGVGAVIAVGVLGLLSYYIYQGDNNASAKVTPAEVQPQKQENKFQME